MSGYRLVTCRSSMVSPKHKKPRPASRNEDGSSLTLVPFACSVASSYRTNNYADLNIITFVMLSVFLSTI